MLQRRPLISNSSVMSPAFLRCLLQAMYAALRRHPSIWIVPLLAVLVLATGGIVGVMTAAATETRQARLNAEGAQSSWHMQQQQQLV